MIRPVARRSGIALVAVLTLTVPGLAACTSPAGTTTAPDQTTTQTGGQAGASGGDTAVPPSTLVTDDRPRTVTTFTAPLVDTSRPTVPVTEGAPGSAVRDLPTTVYLPSGSGPAPLVVFSHGLGGSPKKFTRLHTAWAEAGYVVAAPQFPLTSDANPDHGAEVGDLVNQPADVSFVLDEMLAAAADPASQLAGRIDPDHVGAAGLSLGGATTYGVIFNDCCADPRFSAAMIMAGAVLVYTGTNDYSRDIPTLVFHGDDDLALRYELGRNGWDVLPSPTWLVTLLGAPHAPPFEDAVTPWDDAVIVSSTAFWDATLGADPAGLARMTDTIAGVPDLAVIESR
jgi:dienelactone hydrolase